MSTFSALEDMPLEIWLQIFKHAGNQLSRHYDRATHYIPCAAVEMDKRSIPEQKAFQEALTIQRTLVLVCKTWHECVSKSLYECIRIHHGTHALLDVLKSRAGSSLDYGNFVRRVEIAEDMQDFDPLDPGVIYEILAYCPSIETFTRPCLSLPGGINLQRPRSPPPLPIFSNLKRIDWWHKGIFFRPNSNFALPWISDFLEDIIDHSPNIDYLCFSRGTYHPVFHPATKQPTWESKSISTLHLEDEGAYFRECVFKLPNLTRLIITQPKAVMSAVASQYGLQIKVLEVISFPAGAMGEDIANIWKKFPHLEEFAAPLQMGVCFTQGTSAEARLPRLTTLRIKLDQCSPSDAPKFGRFVRNYLRAPVLERIVLHGNIAAWKENECYISLEEYVAKRQGVSLLFNSDESI